jgi:hypothetical protein
VYKNKMHIIVSIVVSFMEKLWQKSGQESLPCHSIVEGSGGYGERRGLSEVEMACWGPRGKTKRFSYCPSFPGTKGEVIFLRKVWCNNIPMKRLQKWKALGSSKKNGERNVSDTAEKFSG